MFRPTAGEVKVLIQNYGRIIFEQPFTGRDGKTDVFGPLFDATKTPVVVLPLTKDNKVVAIRQFRYGANEFVLEIPGGNPKPGQSPKECLQDELVEETGYQPEEVVIFEKGKWFDPASVRVQCILSLALGCRWVKPPKPDRTEIIEVVEIPFAKWLEMIESGEIDDMKTLGVTLLALLHLGMIKSLEPEAQEQGRKLERSQSEFCEHDFSGYPYVSFDGSEHPQCKHCGVFRENIH